MLDVLGDGVHGNAMLFSGQFRVSGSDTVSVYIKFSMALYCVLLQKKSDPRPIQVNRSHKSANKCSRFNWS